MDVARSDFTGVLTPRDITSIIVKRVGTTNFQIVNQSLKDVSAVSGYMGQYYRISITVKLLDAESEEIRELKYFAKVIPRVENVQTRLMVGNGIFTKEVAVYTEIFPNFENVTWSPRCFLGVPDGILVFDDLSGYGYEMGNKFDYFDLEECEMVLKKLAEMHAQSFIYEEKSTSSGEKRNLWNNYGNYLTESFFRHDEKSEGHKYSLASIKAHAKFVEIMDVTEEEKERLRRVGPLVLLRLFEFVEPSNKYRNVLCHGDLWSNNILFQRKNNVVIDCKFVDFQMTRYNPPAHDVVSFLHFTTPLEFRKRHDEHLFEFYHSRLAENLATEGKLEIDDVLPLSNFFESCRYYVPQAVIQLIYYYQLLMADDRTTDKYFRESPELAESLYVDKTKFVSNQLNTNPIYRTKMRDAMMAFKEMCDVYFHHLD